MPVWYNWTCLFISCIPRTLGTTWKRQVDENEGIKPATAEGVVLTTTKQATSGNLKNIFWRSQAGIVQYVAQNFSPNDNYFFICMINLWYNYMIMSSILIIYITHKLNIKTLSYDVHSFIIHLTYHDGNNSNRNHC